MKYRPDVDGLRAVAILPVLLFHSGAGAFSGGFVGVDVFFVISGYVIARSLQEDLDNGRFSVWRFYAKRIRRIFPALFVTIAVTCLFAYLLLLPAFYIDFSQSLLAASAFLSNVYFWKTSGYFAADAAFRPLLHTWSLSVEEQFYLFMPVAMYVIYSFFSRRWLLFLLPAILVSLGLSIFLTSTGPTANFYLLPTRAWELLIGAILALARLPVPRQRWPGELLGGLGLAMIAWAVFAYDETTPFPGLAALLPCLGSALLIYVGLAPAPPLATRLLSLRPLVFTGLISYSLYLVHWPIVSFAHHEMLRPPNLIEMLVIVVASFILATLSWRFVEQPFRRPRPAVTQPRLLAGGVTAIGVFALVGTLGIVAEGFPGRTKDFASVEIAGHEHWNQGRCFLGADPNWHNWDADDCALTEAVAPEVLLWGDSFAAHYVPGIVAHSAKFPVRILQYTAAGCPPVVSYFSYARPRCAEFNANALQIIGARNIKAVILSGRWTDLQSRGLDQLRSTLDALASLGVETYVIGLSPQFSADVRIIAHKKGGRTPDAVDRWKVFFDPAINTELQQYVAEQNFIDPLQRLCRDAVCPYREGGAYLYEDAEHFSVYGSGLAVFAFFPFLERTPSEVLSQYERRSIQAADQ
jgi:peptidoglycan/LPS O-acetylase OafA/YrhL